MDNKMTGLDRFMHTLLFKEVGGEVSEGGEPRFTTGSIVLGALMRTAFIVIASMAIIGYYRLYDYWWWVILALWLLVAYPAYQAYKKFSTEIQDIEESTLCGSCRNFEPTGQLCRLYDEHITKDYIPCEGNDWEPK
jgi:hypothetical protein